MNKTIQEETNEAIDLAYENAHHKWRKMATECLRHVCLQMPEFTANDVREIVLKSPLKTHDNRAMGGIMKSAARLGWISPTGRSIPSRVGHKTPLQIWKSNLYQPMPVQPSLMIV